MAPLSKKVIAWVAAGIATATLALVVVLWWAGTSGLDGEKLVTARFDALRTGLSIGLGGGGLFALYLAWRRQHSTEIGLAQKQQDQADVARAYDLQRETAEATQRDAEARRITELYTKAVEQLGSDKAPVRLGGLYALERLAQDHVEQRQTIVNVLCAYLRMPYTLPGDPPETDAVTDPDLRKELTAEHRDGTQEREVRLTAQRILTHHLRPGPDNPVETFWENIDLDLTGATLINFTLTNCTVRTAEFDRATFIGTTRFDEATFTGNARFTKTAFTGNAWFTEATFTGNAWFVQATFTRDTWFVQATFTREAWFVQATFTGDAWFAEATFTHDARFDGATLPSTRYVDRTTPSPWTNFHGACFKHSVPAEVAGFVSEDEAQGDAENR
ncbi:pentapeptide repeat-containing protein [Actinokineospora sp. 24-640]